MKITSAKNPHVKNVMKLRHSHHRREQNRFIVEGLRCVTRAVAAGVAIKQLFLAPDLLDGGDAMSQIRDAAETTFELPDDVFARIAYRDRPEGILAVAQRPTHALAGLPVADRGLYIVAESLEKPGNLGAILRSADAAGVDGLILCDRHTDIYNPNAITASTATVFAVPIAEASVDETLAWLTRHGIPLAATVCDRGRDYASVDWTGPVAIALGTEHSGLSAALQDAASLRVTIPMAGAADSLNVAATATVLLFEAARQRRRAR